MILLGLNHRKQKSKGEAVTAPKILKDPKGKGDYRLLSTEVNRLVALLVADKATWGKQEATIRKLDCGRYGVYVRGKKEY